MICQTVAELAPIIGTRPGVPGAGRRAGNALPSPPAARRSERESSAAEFFGWYNQDDRHSGIGLMAPATVHYGRVCRCTSVAERLDAAYQATPERFIRRAPKAPPGPTAAWINKPTTTEEAAHEEPTFLALLGV
jgi:hypothetical protein